MKWFRFDANTANHPTVRSVKKRLGNEGFGALANLWCFTAERGRQRPGRAVNGDGKPYRREALVDASEMSEEKFDQLIEVLLETECMNPEAWHERQEMHFPGMFERADDTTKKKWKALDKAGEDDDGTPSTPEKDRATPTESEKRRETPEVVGGLPEKVGVISPTVQDSTEQDSTEQGQGDNVVALFPPPLTDPQRADQVRVDWNDITSRPLPRCQPLSAKRVTHTCARLKEHNREVLKEAFTRIEASDFCRGTNDRGWVMTFDWLMGSQDHVTNVLEDRYKNKAPRRAPPSPGRTGVTPGKYAALVRGRKAGGAA